jgi:hypothetical protein
MDKLKADKALIDKVARELKERDTKARSPPVCKPDKPILVPNSRRAPIWSNPRHVKDRDRWKIATPSYLNPGFNPRARSLPAIDKTTNRCEIKFFHGWPYAEMFQYDPEFEYQGGCQGCGFVSMCEGPATCKWVQHNRAGQIFPHPAVYFDKSDWTACPYSDAELEGKKRTFPRGEPCNRPEYVICQCCSYPIDPSKHGGKASNWLAERAKLKEFDFGIGT